MNDQPSLDVLAAIGPPPWASREKNMTYRKVMTTYQAQMTTVPTAPVVIAKEYEADFTPDGGVFRQAVDFSARHFWGPTLAGPATRVHVTSLTDFKIPIFFIHGAADLTAPPELTQAYFEVIRAPGKKLYLVPGAAHDPSSAAQKLLRDVLLTEVRPMAR
jgi:pimeloyl-ACP methyl ester carboxylesterase